MNKIKYPSLYATTEPATLNGHRGSNVRCTATQRSIGFVYWHADGKHVEWKYESGQQRGSRSTERNAVQALRDISNADSAGQQIPLVYDVEIPRGRPSLADVARDTRVIDVAPVRTSVVVPAASVAAPKRSLWGTATDIVDLTAAIGRAFRNHGDKR